MSAVLKPPAPAPNASAAAASWSPRPVSPASTTASPNEAFAVARSPAR